MGAVVLYHLWPAWLPGGFVGVDVFFVISGFLITSQLLSEFARTGRISLVDFWARRMRRLLPAAIAVLAACLALLYFVMPRFVAAEDVKEIVAAAAYIENWFLVREGVDYLASESDPSIVQHYWSLSVEEQFYLGWPLLLLVSIALAGRNAPAARRRYFVLGAMAAAALGSFALSVAISEAQGPLAFFGAPTRVWEFAAGGLLALAPLSADTAARQTWASWLGLAAIGWSVFALGEDDAFPGAIAAVPVAGAALVIVGGMPASRWAPTALFNLRATQFLGDHSYALYLWHWPLVVAAPWVFGARSIGIDLGILLALPVLALTTKRYIEDPVRRGALSSVRPRYVYAAAGFATLVVASVGLAFHAHIRTSVGVSAKAAAAALEKQDPCFGAGAMTHAADCAEPFRQPDELDLIFASGDIGPERSCQSNRPTVTPSYCVFGERTEQPARTVAVVGNSHGVRLVPALEEYGKPRRWQIVLAAKTDCLGLVAAQPAESNNPCAVWSRKVHDYLLSTHFDAVVFASHVAAEQYMVGLAATSEARDAAKRAAAHLWSELRRRGTAVIVAEDVPGMRPEAGPQCIAYSQGTYDPCFKLRDEVVRGNLLTEIAAELPQLVTYLPVAPYLCDDVKCHSLIGGVVVYSDSHHLTATFSRSMGQFLGPQVEAAMAANAPPPSRHE